MKPSSYYLLRLPTLPIADNTPAVTDPASQLRQLWEETHFSEAIFVASPALYTQICSHLGTSGWPLPQALAQTLHKYALRMSCRATPFGLMAGFSVGRSTTTSQIGLAPQHHFVRHHRLDMDCVAGLVRTLVNEPAIRVQLRFFPNNSQYVIDGELRYTERDDSGTERHYFLSAVAVTDFLTAVLKQAESGATPPQLIASLLKTGILPNDATLFIDQLIENQLLVSELEPMLTGPPVLANLQYRLNQLIGTEPIVTALTNAVQTLSQVSADSRIVHRTIRESLEPFFTDVSEQYLIQTDVQINTTVNQISSQVIETILGQIERLKPLNRPRLNPQLTDFSQRFLERYDQQEIDLQTVLDGDIGIGYGDTSGGQASFAALIDDLALPKTEQPVQLTWGPYENLLLAKLSQALRTGQQVVDLTDDELIPLSKTEQPTIPASFYVFGNLLSSSNEALDRGDFSFNVNSVEGPSAATLLGRFCAHSQELTNSLRQSLRLEEQQRPDVIYAEIIHWPDDRLGNILVRPALRPYEIPYISQASVDADYQIPLNDLLVSVLPTGRILLRSKRYGKEVIPRLSTAHNYRSGLSTYQFLADLQYQDAHISLSWDWKVLRDQPFLPRITYRNLIVSRARWTITQASLPVGSTPELIHYLKTTCRLPRWIAIAEGDNELALDLTTQVGQQLLADEVRRHPIVRLVEWVATPEQCWIHQEGHTYVNELVIPGEFGIAPQHQEVIQRVSPGTTSTQERPSTNHSTPSVIRRSFGPGSEWVYVKLYAGTQIADNLLKTLIWPFIQDLISQNVTETFFFIRYADPEPHLRLRLYGSIPAFYGVVLDQLNAWLEPYRQTGSVYRVQTDTYEREIERYGSAAMIDSEHLFDRDSWATLRYLAQETDPNDRWQFALKSCDALLNDFGLDIQTKVYLVQHLQTQFLAEHRANRLLRQQLNDRFRVERGVINTVLASVENPEFHQINVILAERSATLRPIVKRIETATAGSEPALFSLLASYLHMSLNRLFAARQRTHELVIYHFLARYYESQRARQSAP